MSSNCEKETKPLLDFKFNNLKSRKGFVSCSLFAHFKCGRRLSFTKFGLKSEERIFYHKVVPPKDADRNANNEDPDQTTPQSVQKSAHNLHGERRRMISVDNFFLFLRLLFFALLLLYGT